MQAQWRNNGFRLRTRSGHDWTHRYPVLADELWRLDLEGTIIDGELTVLDVEGKSNFDLLQHASGNSEVALAYFAFDLLYLRGQDQREKKLIDRKAALESLIISMNGKSPTSRLQYLDHVKSGLKTMISQCRSLGLEGIVSKRVDRGYISGRASDWLKTKLRYRENLIIVGYETAGKPAALSDCRTDVKIVRGCSRPEHTSAPLSRSDGRSR